MGPYIDTSRSTPARLHRGKWWRFSDYEYVDYRIRPTKDARLEMYDPWAEYEAAWSDRAAADPRLSSVAALPYQRLFDLMDVKYEAGGFCAEHGEQIAAWCREFGLLGLLPHRMISATFPAKWGEKIWDGEASFIAIKSWVPSSDGWFTIDIHDR